MNAVAKFPQHESAPMQIEVPPALAAKLRQRLAELELPEEAVKLDVLETLANMLEDDSLLLGAWVHDDLETAERVARRIFAREKIGRIEIAFGEDENPTTVEFLRGWSRADASEEDRADWEAEVRRLVKKDPARYRVLTAT